MNEEKEEMHEEQKEPEKKKKNKKRVVLVVLILLILCGAGIGTYLYLNGTKPTSKKIKSNKKEVKNPLRISGNSLEDFDLYFLKLENEEKNKVYSPLSIKYALEMLSEGANGNTKKQIDAIIGDYKVNKYPNNEHMSFANAMFIRDTFKDKIKTDYANNLVNKYAAEVITDSFTNADNINSWVSNKTLNLINNIVDNDSIADKKFYLINALAIDMNWNNQVHCEESHKIPCVNNGDYHISYLHEKLDDDATDNYSHTEHSYNQEDDFYSTFNNKHEFAGIEQTKGGEVFADFNKYDIIKELGEDKIREIIKPEYEQWLATDQGKAATAYDPSALNVDESINKYIEELKTNYGQSANSTDFLVYEDDNVREFAKDLQTYDGKTLQYIGIMPKNTELTEYIKNTNKDELNKIISGLKEVKIDSFDEGYATRIRGFIPFFKYDYDLDLLKDLEDLGITEVFSDSKADLSNLTDEKGVFIEDALHKANIEFSNDGIKASAVTAMGGGGATSGPKFEHLFKVPVKDISVNFNKPYMYFVRDKESGEVWFTGTVYEPIRKG